MLKCETASASSSSKTSGDVGWLIFPHHRFWSDSEPTFLTNHLSFGERPVNLPVSTANTSPYFVLQIAPSLFAT